MLTLVRVGYLSPKSFTFVLFQNYILMFLKKQTSIFKCYTYYDKVVVDRGFTIEELVMQKGGKLVIPPFLGKKERFSKEETVQTKLIARARIHIERFNERIKNFKIISGVVPLNLVPLLSQIVFVLCCLVNFQEPLVI